MEKNGAVDAFHLVKEEDHSKIVAVLKKRLPYSGNVFNMASTLHKFTSEMKCFSLDGNLGEDAVIMITFTREDYGQDINISLPEKFEPSEYTRDAFASTKTIDWVGPHLFVCVDRRISTLIFEIDTRKFRNSVIFNPAYSYWISKEDAEKFGSQSDGDGVSVKKLERIQGVKFILENWKSSRAGTAIYVKRIIENSLSAGVYCGDQLMAAALVSGYGLIGPITTSAPFRRQGCATKCFKFLLQEMAKEGLAPVSSSAQNNRSYVQLHEKLGMTVTHESDWIFHTGSGADTRLGPTAVQPAKKVKLSY